jgi:CDP-4-dehydro-6-deoxyglucose reductase, E3
MAKTCTVAVNGQTFKANAGDVLLDAAIANGVHIPHDCRSGLCGSCMAKVVQGSTILGETPVPGMVQACQARILSDIKIETEEAPAVTFAEGRVTLLRELAPDVVEVSIEPDRRLIYRPGQYFKFKFKGFPTRSYSATRPLNGRSRARTITLQIRRLEGGRVSAHLGRSIKAGHSVSIEGPYGSAFLRDGKTERLVLLSSGTGFAPIWGIACAALRENQERKIVLIAGVRTVDPIYMTSALAQLVRFPNVEVIATIGRRPSASEQVREGYPNDHIPPLCENDIVYACGPSHLIDALSPLVAGSKAQFHFDPFEPAPDEIDIVESLKRFRRILTEQPEFVVTVPNPLVSLKFMTSG